MIMYDALPSDTILDRYRIEKVLGRGGFGITYKAIHQTLGNITAIKEFFPQEHAHREHTTGHLKPFRSSEDYQRGLKRFIREGQILATLNHPSIVKVTDLFEDKDTAYLVMEFIEGKTLRDELDSQPERCLRPSQIGVIIESLVEALSTVHEKGIYHLDIKPENVLITPEGLPKLIDFGAARQNLGGKTTQAFSAAYAPPEVIAGSTMTASSDIFEMGMMLHEMLTGELPPSATARLTSLALKHEDCWDNSGLSSPWRELLIDALQLEMGRRSATIRQWWEKAKTYWNQPKEKKKVDKSEITPPNQRVNQSSAPSTPSQQNQPSPPNILPSPTPPNRVIRPQTVGRRNLLKYAGYGGLGLLAVGGLTWWRENNNSQGNVILEPFTFETVKVNDRGDITEQETKQGEQFSVDLGNGVSLEMVKITGGTFMMGSPETEEGRYNDESPQHEVTVSDFYIGKYQVTQGQWQAVMGNNPSDDKNRDNYPVERVSWNDCQKFCQKLSEETGLPFSLPSEAQWEYACRAGTTTPFYYGETLSTDIANYDGTGTYGKGKKGIYRSKTTEVGTFPANGFGLYDMHGNVWEFCQDDYVDNYRNTPRDGNPHRNNSIERIVRRGGSWYYYPSNCRSALRYDGSRVIHFSYIGFRVMCVIGETS